MSGLGRVKIDVPAEQFVQAITEFKAYCKAARDCDSRQSKRDCNMCEAGWLMEKLEGDNDND